MEQVKGTTELKQKIIAAAKEARKLKDYPIELKLHDCVYIQEKFSDNTNRPSLDENHGSAYPHLEGNSSFNIPAHLLGNK